MEPVPGEAPSDPPETRTGAQILHDGETLAAHHVAAVLTEVGTNRAIEWDEFNIGRIDADAYVFEVNGLTYAFGLEDEEGYSNNGRQLDLVAEDSSGREYASGRLRYSNPERDEHAIVIRHTSEAPNWRGFAIAGNRSHQIDETRMGTATYNDGFSTQLEIYQPEGQIWSRYRDVYWAYDGQLVADFDAMTISGQFDEWYTDARGRDENGDWPSIDISATLESAPITADGFTGAFSVTGVGLDGTFDATYEGSFYGPAAEDAAGVISGTYTEMPGQAANPVIGWFFAGQSEE